MTIDVNTHLSEPSETNDETAWPTLTIDYALYDKYLKDSDLSEEEKREFLDAIWGVVVAFVDFGFGVHPVQQICEQALDLSDQRIINMLDSKATSVNKTFLKAAKETQPDNTERKEA